MQRPFYRHVLVRFAKRRGGAIQEESLLFRVAHYVQGIDTPRILFSSTLQATELLEG
jgi:hypothetical protein